MIQQSIAQFMQNAQKATSIVDDDKLPDRQRGMWSFLTWSFFLAQAVAAHEAYAKGHGGSDGGPDGDGAGHGGADDAAQKSLAAAQVLGASGFDLDPTAAAQFAAAVAAGLVTPQMWAAFQTDPALFQAFVDHLTGHASAASAIMLEAAASGGEYGVGAGDADHGSHGPLPGIDLPGINLPGITLPIDVAIDLGLELGSDLGLGVHIGGLDDISINLNAAPIVHLGLDGEGLNLSLLGIDISNGHDGGVLGSILGGSHSVLSGLPLGGAMDTLSSVTGLASDTLGGTLGHLTGATSHLLGNTTQITSQLLGGAEPALAPVTSIIGNVLDYGSHSGLLASGGSILQSVGSALPLNDMFAHGQHTDYGMELQASQSTEPVHSGSLIASLSTSVDTFDVGALADDTLKTVLHGISHDWSHG